VQDAEPLFGVHRPEANFICSGRQGTAKDGRVCVDGGSQDDSQAGPEQSKGLDALDAAKVRKGQADQGNADGELGDCVEGLGGGGKAAATLELGRRVEHAENQPPGGLVVTNHGHAHGLGVALVGV
jgi:hypothetical protein